MKPKVLIAVLTGLQPSGWINPILFDSLLVASKDTRYDVHIECVSKVPVAHARNFAVVRAREERAAYCMMIDNDQAFPPRQNMLEFLVEGLDIVTVPTVISRDGKNYGPNYRLTAGPIVWDSSHRVFQVADSGSGVLFLSKAIWEKLKGPWFRWLTSETELGTTLLGEDIFFCKRAVDSGFKIWAHPVLISHFKTSNMLVAFDLQQRLIEAQKPTQPQDSAFLQQCVIGGTR